MENYIEVTKTVKVRYALKEPLTQEQLDMIKEDDIYNLPDRIIDFDKEETIDEKHHLSVAYEDGEELVKHGRRGVITISID